MKIEIDEIVLKKVNYCKKDFTCLECQSGLCRVEHCIGENIIFVTRNDPCEYCHYMNDFGGRVYCSCPLRKIIYLNHRV